MENWNNIIPLFKYILKSWSHFESLELWKEGIVVKFCEIYIRIKFKVDVDDHVMDVI
jgi:hypothetical protein